jgi:hypothetical protein
MIIFSFRPQRSQSLRKVRKEEQDLTIKNVKKAAGMNPAALNNGGKYIELNLSFVNSSCT